jgi:prefoldin subunit 2
VCVHRLVLETLEPLPADRKCFRMINGVLVERTVKDVIPALKTNSDGLRKVLEDLVKQYNSKQVEMEKWKVYSLGKQRRIRSADIWSTEEE